MYSLFVLDFILLQTAISVPAVSKKSTNNIVKIIIIVSGFLIIDFNPNMNAPTTEVSKSALTICVGVCGMPEIPNFPKITPTIAVIKRPIKTADLISKLIKIIVIISPNSANITVGFLSVPRDTRVESLLTITPILTSPKKAIKNPIAAPIDCFRL